MLPKCLSSDDERFHTSENPLDSVRLLDSICLPPNELVAVPKSLLGAASDLIVCWRPIIHVPVFRTTQSESLSLVISETLLAELTKRTGVVIDWQAMVCPYFYSFASFNGSGNHVFCF